MKEEERLAELMDFLGNNAQQRVKVFEVLKFLVDRTNALDAKMNMLMSGLEDFYKLKAQENHNE